MPTAVLLRASHSHLYPGSVVHVGTTLDANRPQPAVIEFVDGSGASAMLVRPDDDHDALELAVDAYVTQNRHAVAARRWLLRPADAARIAWRVAKRLPVG
ncbi:hypothetical protein DM992_27010 [Burkholderia sp. JP2-270]|uniref:hypothetical protein n=1 Tax=Burkholderia sp. JP2-270 TaxID=2217913 RepID=UPI000DA41AB7|nr:hypothetical protein [Burkholderia sp. JP2-270]AWV02987.1 hypothetical protein DM992_27010 [Burkholderia sp. JP2-270]